MHMSQSPMYASRMYGMVLLQMHYAVSGSLVWEMGDEDWNKMCWGITDRGKRPKQAMASLRSVVSHVGKGESCSSQVFQTFQLYLHFIYTRKKIVSIAEAHPVSTSFDNSNCVVGVVYNPSEERTVIGISNLLRMDTDTICRKQLIVDGIKEQEIASDNSFELFCGTNIQTLISFL